MEALVGAFNQEKALVGAVSVIVQPVVELMEHYMALKRTIFPLPLDVTPTSYPRYPHPNQLQDPNIPPLAHHSATITSYGKYVDKAG